MCELLSMNANTQTYSCISFSGLMQGGGKRVPVKMDRKLVFMKRMAVVYFMIQSLVSTPKSQSLSCIIPLRVCGYIRYQQGKPGKDLWRSTNNLIIG